MKKPHTADTDAGWGFSVRFHSLFNFFAELRVIQITLRHADDHVDIVGSADGIRKLHNVSGQIFQIIAINLTGLKLPGYDLFAGFQILHGRKIKQD